ncbi:MAG TPA: hypothetical protein PKA51_14005 [Kiritimatiellia bacterium]|nr:hypothetical protein [Kiritimatiellia bacterium]
MLIGLVMLGCVAHADRIPIAAHQVPYIITNSGSFVVTDNLTATGTAITVNADLVTIDLNGYIVSGTVNGILQSPGRHGLTVRNGRLRAPLIGYGLQAQGRMTRVVDVTVLDYASGGLLVGDNALLRNVEVGPNAATNLSAVFGITAGPGLITRNVSVSGMRMAGGNGYGVLAAESAMIHGVQVRDNRGAQNFTGVAAGPAAVVRDLAARDNQAGTSFYGATLGEGSVASSVAIATNQSTGISRGVFALVGTVFADLNITGVDWGVQIFSNSIVTRSVFDLNNGSAVLGQSGNLLLDNSARGGNITVGNDNLIAGNNLRGAPVVFDSRNYVFDNHFTGVTNALFANGNLNRVDRNASDVGAGMIDAGGVNNLIVRNRGPNFSVNAGANDHVAATLNGSASMTAAQPWANINTAP